MNIFPSLGIVILAAGASRRMGRPKQTLVVNGTTLLNRSIAVAKSIGSNPLVVVLGANYKKIRPTIVDPGALTVENKDWDTGMGSTIREGVQTMLKDHPDLDAVLLLLVDQPFVTTDLLQQMVRKYVADRPPIVAAKYAETFGVPALFDRTMFGDLLNLEGPTGARFIIRNFVEKVAGIPFPEGAIDLDTPEDWLCYQSSIANKTAKK